MAQKIHPPTDKGLLTMDLSIVIVNWHSKDFLRSCIYSIESTKDNLYLEIVVVDNASHDGCENMLRNEFPGVTFIQSSENQGFARANNLGVCHTTAQYILFLNPDTEIRGTAILKLVSFFDATPDAGAAGCKLLNSDGTLQESCVQSFPGVVNQALDSAWLRRIVPRSSLWGKTALYGSDTVPLEVEAISGACLAVRRKAFDAVGGFSEDYFMYTEDVDLCWKLHRAGWKNYVLTSAEVVHHGGISSGQRVENAFAAVTMCKSHWLFLRKTRGITYARVYRLTMALSALARIVILFLFKGFSRKLDNSHTKWLHIMGWSAGINSRKTSG